MVRVRGLLVLGFGFLFFPSAGPQLIYADTFDKSLSNKRADGFLQSIVMTFKKSK